MELQGGLRRDGDERVDAVEQPSNPAAAIAGASSTGAANDG